MNTSVIEPLAALSLLIAFLFGITFGVVGGTVLGSRRGALLRPRDPLSVGAWALLGVYVRDDDGYLHGLLPGGGDTRDDPGAAGPGREAGR
jgi:hypothetical protein